jgi:TorA maturation chaperone TorD
VQALASITAATFSSPGESLEDDLVTGRLQAAADQIALLHGLTPEKLPSPSLEHLRAAYVSLFVTSLGGAPAPPYAGLVKDGVLLGPTSEAIAGEYQRLGVNLASSWTDLPDHLAAIGEAATLLAASRPAAARKLLLDHLLPWLRRFAPVVLERDTSGFYARITSLLLAALEEESRGNHP